MTAQTFEISVGLDPHRIDVVEDAKSGKTTIRLDGRMAARPMTAAESSREVQVGPERYEVHRTKGGDFELEFLGAVEQPAPSLQAPGARPQAAAVKTSSFPVFRIIGTLVLFAILGVAYPWIRDALGIGWYRYAAPDGSFSYQMPVPPISDRHNVSGIAVTEYSIAVGVNEYYVGYAQLPSTMLPGRDQMLIDQMRDSLLKRHNAKVLSDRTITRGAIVVAHSDKDNVDYKFKIVLTEARLYVIGAVAPPNRLGAVAIQRFFTTFKYYQ